MFREKLPNSLGDQTAKERSPLCIGLNLRKAKSFESDDLRDLEET